MSRFVLLEHDHPYLHWDLMLQEEDVLWTWRLDAPPASEPVRAVRVPDHRLPYLDYEGQVSGNRGTVRRLDRGELIWRRLEEGLVKVILKGERFHGNLQLCRVEGDCWEVVYLGNEIY